MKPIRLIYIANARIPTEKAHGIQIMKTCESLERAGVNLELWLPRRRNRPFAGQDIFQFYGLKVRFPVKKVFCLDLIGWLNFLPGSAFYLQSKSFAWGVKKTLKQPGYKGAVFYSRDLYPLVPVMRAGLPYFYEAHDIGKKSAKLRQLVCQKARGVIAISKGLFEVLREMVSEERLLVAEDGVDLDIFSGRLKKNQARLRLGFSSEQKIILYTGHLYAWKGARVLAQAAEYLPSDVWVYFVGGTEKDLSEFKRFIKGSRLSRIKIVGQVAHQEIPWYLAAADVLVLPNSGRFDISRLYTSPLKLFEYMAAGRPIIASDLPSLREILDERTAVFFIPDDPISLSRKIKLVLADDGLGQRLATNAINAVRKYSWASRAKKIIDFINSRLSIYAG